MRRALGRRPRGMTLMETVVMLALLGVFGALAVPMIRSTMRGIRRNQDFGRQFVAGRAALEELSAQVRQLQALPGASAPVLRGEDRGVGAAARDTLQLTGANVERLGRGTLFTITYYLEASPDGPSVLWKRYQRPDGTEYLQPVAQNIVAFDCAYSAAGIWQPAWTGPGLPEAVRLTVHVVPHHGARPRAMFTDVNVIQGTG